MGRDMEVWLLIQLCAVLGAVAQHHVQSPTPLPYLAGFEDELQTAAYKVLQQEDWQYEFPEFNMPSDFMHSFIPGTGVGNREDLEVDVISSTPVYYDMIFTKWRYERYNNSDCVLGIHKNRVALWRTSFTDKMLFHFASSDAIFIYSPEDGSVVLDAILFSTFINHVEALYVAVLMRDNESDTIRIYEITSTGEILVTIIDLGLRTLQESTVYKNKIAYVQSQHVGSLVVLVDRKGENKIIYQKKGSSTMSHYIEANCESPVDLVSFSINGHGYIAVAGKTTAEVFKMDDYLQDHISFERFPYGENIVDLEYFRLGFHHYLAVADENYQTLYVWKSGGLFSKQDFYFTGAKQWYSALLPTCRDDVLLFLIQKHSAEVFAWDGKTENFARIPYAIPLGFNPLAGSITSFSYNVTAFLLFTDEKENTLMASVETSLKPVPDPVLTAGKEVSEMMKKLQNILEKQHEQMKNISTVLTNAVRYSGNQTFTVSQKFTNLQIDDGLSSELINRINWKNSPITEEEFLQGTEGLEFKVKRMEDNLNSIESILKDVVLVDENALITGPKTMAISQGNSLKVDSLFIESVSGMNIRKAQNEIYRLDRPQLINGIVDFTRLNILEDMDVKLTVNGLDFSEELMTTNLDQESRATMIFRDKLNILGNLDLSGTVNGIDINNDIVKLHGSEEITGRKNFLDGIVVENAETNLLDGVDLNELNRKALTLTGDQVIRGETNFGGAVYVSEINLAKLINGNNISQISEDLVRINEPTEIRGPKSFLGITIKNDLVVTVIDNTKIPDDLLVTDEVQVIPSVKNFQNAITAHDVSVIGKIDGLDLPSDIITLTGNEIIDTTLYFTSGLTVKNEVTSHGLVDGVDIKSLTSSVLGNEHAAELKDIVFLGPVTVLKDVHVEGNTNGIPLKEMVKDLVFRDDKEVIFSAPKIYSSVVAGSVTIKNEINGYDLTEDFMFADGNQIVKGAKTFMKPVKFNDLHTGDGKISGIDIAELYQKRIQLQAEDNIEKFENIVIEGNLLVDGFLNGMKFPDDIVLKSAVQAISSKNFEGDLHVDQLEVDGNLKVSNKFSGVYLSHLFDQTVSLIGNEEILSDITLGNTRAFSVISGLVNDLDIVEFTENVMSLSKNQTITASKVFSGNVNTFGRVTTHGINGFNLADVEERALKLHDTAVITAPQIFEDTLSVGNIYVGDINRVNFDELVYDSVRTNGLQHITSETVFHKGFHVDGNIKAEVNGLDVSTNIVGKRTPQEITGKYTFGSITVSENIIIDGLVNDTDLSEMSFQVAKSNLQNTMESNLIFKKQVDILSDFDVAGLINGKNSSQLTETSILEDGDQHIRGTKILEGSVSIYGDINATLINRVHWIDFLQDVVRIDLPQNIPAPKAFSSDLEVNGDIFVTDKVAVQLINGINLEKFLNEAVFIDKAANISGPKVITAPTEIRGEMMANLINGLNLKRDAITLQCVDEADTQIISGSKEFQNLTVMGHVIVEGEVNGYKLPDLYQDTLTTFGNQTVKGSKYFTGLLTAERNVYANVVNGLDLKHLVSLSTNQAVDASMTFMDDVVIKGNFNISGLLNEIDLDVLNNILYTDTNQTITGSYLVEKAVTESVSLTTINGLDLKKFAGSVNQFYEDTVSRRDMLIEMSESQCQAAKYLRSVVEASYYSLEGFDVHQILNYSADFIEINAETNDMLLIQTLEEGSSVTVLSNSFDSSKDQFVLSAEFLTTIVKRKSFHFGGHRLIINIGAESKDSFVSYNKEELAGIRGFVDGDATLVNNEVYLALLHEETGYCEMFTIRNLSSSYPSISHAGNILVGKEAKSVSALQALGDVYVAFARKFSNLSSTKSSVVYRWENGWKLVQEFRAPASLKVTNFEYLAHNYLIFTNSLPVSETLEPQYIQVYRYTGDKNHPFKLYQRIQFDDAQSIEVFKFGNIPDLHLMTFNATRVQVYRLNGEAGFTPSFTLSGKCVTTVKTLFVKQNLFLVVSQHDRNYVQPSISVIYRGVTQGSIVPRKELKYCL